MKKPVIAVDIDDVLANSSEALRLEVNRRLGVNLLPEHYQLPGDYWGQYERVWQQNGLSDRISMKDLEPAMEANQAHVLPYREAFKVLKTLSKHYTLIVITSRPSSWRVATSRWVSDNFPDLFAEVLFSDGGDKTKGDLCAEHNASWLIDDNVEHALSAEKAGINVIVFGTYGWHHKLPSHMTHCKDWNAVQEFFDARG